MQMEEWLTSHDPVKMVDCALFGDSHANPYPSIRRMRLFAAAFFRQREKNHQIMHVIDIAERYADDEIGAAALLLTHLKMREICHGLNGKGQPCDWPVAMAAEMTRPDDCLYQATNIFMGYWHDWHAGRWTGRETADLLRDMIPNPCDGTKGWNPYSARPEMKKEWQTPLVMDLARTTYQERTDRYQLDPFGLTNVADAMEDAGCDYDDLLRHLRGQFLCPKCSCGKTDDKWYGGGGGWCGFCDGDGPELRWMTAKDVPFGYGCETRHYRGCWALDYVLGKE